VFQVMRLSIVVCGFLILAACDDRETRVGAHGSVYYVDDRPKEAKRHQRAADKLAGITYEGLGRPYGCRDDCSRHEAGVA